MQNDNSHQIKLLSRTLKNTLKFCVPGPTFKKVIRLTSDNAIPMESISRAIQANQVYSTFLRSLDIWGTRMNEWEEEERNAPERDSIILDRSVQLLNRDITRNVIAAIQLNRLRGAGLPRTKTEKLTVSPREQLRFAILAEEDCLNRELPGSDLAFLAGFHYDILLAQYTTKKAPKELISTLEKAWEEGLKAARLAASLATHFTSFHHHPYIYSATLVSPLGKVLMAELFPKELLASSWSQFTLECEKLGDYAQLASWVGEFRRFGFSYSELSGILVSFFGLFRAIEPAVYFHRDPQNLRNQDKNLYSLSGLISVSLALASFNSKKDRASLLNSIHLQCLKDLGISTTDIDSIVEKAFK